MEEVLEHFSHEHPLIFVSDEEAAKVDHGGDEEVVCSGCTLSVVLGAGYYSCSTSKCNFFLHKSCAEESPPPPNKITCIVHRKHPLTLYEKNPYFGDNKVCDICDEQVLGFTYCCKKCEFIFHLKCGLEHRFEPKGHQHSFMLEALIRSWIYKCDLCDTSTTDRVSFLCTTCQIRVHKKCTYPYPLTVKQVGHPHQLSLTYSTESKEFKGRLCRICYKKFNHQLCCYTCTTASSSCLYIAHLECATAEDIRDIEEEAALLVMPVDSSNDDDHQVTTTDVGNLKITQDEEEEEEEEEESSPTTMIVPPVTTTTITHFSHKHCLRLLNNNININYDHEEELKKSEEEEVFCDGCTQPISSSSALPYYSCVEKNCNFFLHKSCAELPKKIQHTLHRHPLTLLTKVPWEDEDDFLLFECGSCDRLSNGFTYACEICKFSIDILCSSFSDTLEHKSHPAHVLNLIPICYDGDKWNNCNACNSSSSSQARFVCSEEEYELFRLDLGCASLPYEIKHDCPKHNWHARPLHLIYNNFAVEESSESEEEEEEEEESSEEEEYYCDVCEERRGKNEWFYYCADCDYSVHRGCTVAKYLIKFGKSYHLPRHHSPHPLTLVKNNIIGNPPCATCGDPCKNLVLVCSQCKFYIHAAKKCLLSSSS